MSYFIANFAKQQDSTEKKKPSELKRWGKAIGVGVLGGAGLGALNLKVNKRQAIRNVIDGVKMVDPGLYKSLPRNKRKQIIKKGMNYSIPLSAIGGGLYGAGGYGAYRGAKTIKNRLDKRREENN